MYAQIIEQNAGTIWISDFTADVFPEAPHIKISNNFFDVMQFDDVCIIEDVQVTDVLLSKFNQLTIY